MKKAIIVHGKPDKDEYYKTTIPSPSNAHWLPWVQQQLIVRDILAQAPEMPRPYEPEYEAWRQVFERLDPDSETILIGHSCGAGFLFRWLSENDVKVSKVVLVAPSLGIDWDDRGFFDFETKPGIVSQTDGLAVLVAKNDRPGILQSAAKLKNEVPGIKTHELEDGGHFTYKDMRTFEFPELLEEALT